MRAAVAGTDALQGDVDLVRIEFDELGASETTTRGQLAAARLNRATICRRPPSTRGPNS